MHPRAKHALGHLLASAFGSAGLALAIAGLGARSTHAMIVGLGSLLIGIVIGSVLRAHARRDPDLRPGRTAHAEGLLWALLTAAMFGASLIAALRWVPMAGP